MRFDISPAAGPVDGPLVIRVVEAPPGARITIAATTTDADGRRWSSTNEFAADDQGVVDLARDAPASGSYFTMNPQGLVTTMSPEGGDGNLFALADLRPVEVEVTARHQQDEATATFTRTFQGPDVERSVVAADPVHGTLLNPADRVDRPAVLVVPGVVPADAAALPLAALLANQGYVTLVLDLTGHPGLPNRLREVPLERLADAVAWLRAQPEVDVARVAAVGLERGAEALLGAAAHLPDLDLAGIVGIAPSCVAWQAEDSDRASAWTLGGTPLPCGVARLSLAAQVFPTLTGREADVPLGAYQEALEDIDLLRLAGFPVERIAAPLLLLSGGDDKQWPSAEMADLIVRTRRAASHASADRIHTYAGAGRLLRVPHLPAAGDRVPRADGEPIVLGGHPDENRRASAAAWPEITEFLSHVLDAGVVPAVPREGRPVDPEWPSDAPPEPEPDPEDELARAIVLGVDLDLDSGAIIANPLPPPNPET